jgi:IS5 family transposase
VLLGPGRLDTHASISAGSWRQSACYGEAGVDEALHNLGIRNVVIPRKGRPNKARQAVERGRTFRKHVKWRTGCEGRISHLKRNYGWDRSMIDTTEGARTWTGHGVFAHNLTKIATLTA